MIRRLFRRAAPQPAAPTSPDTTVLTLVGSLGAARRVETDAILASLLRHGVLFDDEFDRDDVYDHVHVNTLDDPDAALGFHDVVGAVAHTLDPLTNLVFVPGWSELTGADVEEFTESICWLAGINTSAVAQPIGPDPTLLRVRFEVAPGDEVDVAVQLVSNGVPHGLVELLAQQLETRLEPRRLVLTSCGADLVISALDIAAMTALNDETGANYSPASPA